MAACVLLVTSFSYADITPKQAEKYLLFTPPNPIHDDSKNKYSAVEKLVGPMFSPDLAVRYGQGYTRFLNVKNLADKGNPYAAYNTALYMLINREKFKFDYMQTLIYLKRAKDGDIADAKFALALIYMNQFDEVAKLINSQWSGASQTKQQKQAWEQGIKADTERLQHLSQQFILELAAMGHEKAYLHACNFYLSGVFLPKGSVMAAMCYDNAVRVFDSVAAKGLLLQLYFSDPAFNSLEFEQRGVALAKKVVVEGNARAMAVLGRQLIYPRHLPYSDPESGTALIQSAAAQGDELAHEYLQQYFDGAGRLLIRPTKPVKNWLSF